MEKLAKILAQEDTVLFIGSGISLWSGLPSWGGLIEKLAVFLEGLGINAELIRNEAVRGDLSQAASYGFDKLNKAQIGEFIRQACNYGHAKPHDIHKRIISLGPTCYVTTNYDNLIEESLRLWQSSRFYGPAVTNRQLTNLADIVGARSKNFIFKPHGDAADSESIILSREQYRQLLPDGERHATLESVKMLMATRPVVYLGFGLRDPDFLYIKDLLANTYQGGTRDHYAIVADCIEDEAGYWRKNYGVNLVGYTTTLNEDGTRDHSALLSLLDSLQQSSISTSSLNKAGSFLASDTILALARHGGRLSRVQKNEPEFPIRVSLEWQSKRDEDWDYDLNRYNYLLVNNFLDNWSKHAVLIGLPGAGKSYSLTQAVARLAEELIESCHQEPFQKDTITIPIYADLKLYAGNISELINESLPNGVSLKFLSNHFKLKIFLDSFNEMPREYWDNAAYESDFKKFIDEYSEASLIIGSRTSDGLSKLGLPCYSLDQIDAFFVLDELESHNLSVTGRFEREILALLQKPFYFQLVINRKIELPTEAHPRDFYQFFFSDLCKSFNQRFRVNFNLEYALSLTAYEAIDKGEEAQPLSNILEIIRNQLIKEKVKSIDAVDVANWLVSKSVIIPYIGGRAAFFHQSATEYLAASGLARRFMKNPAIVKQKLSLTNWDQTLFLSLSQLSNEAGRLFLEHVIDADFALALNATKYLEFNRDEVVSKLLTEIPSKVQNSDPFESGVEEALEDGVSITDIHEPYLREIMKCGDVIGGIAALRLMELRGLSVKDEMMELIAANHHDYNFCANGVGPAIRSFVTSDDVPKMLLLIDGLEGKVTDNSGLIPGFAQAFADIDVDVIREAIFPPSLSSDLSDVRSKFLCEFLRSKHSTKALNFAGDLLLAEINGAEFAFYFIAKYSRNVPLSWRMFTKAHAERLISLMDNRNSWALPALKQLCLARSDIAKFVRGKASRSCGLYKAALLYSSQIEFDPFIYEALNELLQLNSADRQALPIHLIEHIEMNWDAQEELFLRLLRLKDINIAQRILGYRYDSFGVLSIGPIEWWLEWMSDSEVDWHLRDMIAELFNHCLKDEVKKEFLIELNNPESKYREVLIKIIQTIINKLTTDDFTEETIRFLLNDISENKIADYFEGHILSNTATEQFVIERLLPLFSNATSTLLFNLNKILRMAGSRHGRRYISS